MTVIGVAAGNESRGCLVPTIIEVASTFAEIGVGVAHVEEERCREDCLQSRFEVSQVTKAGGCSCLGCGSP